MKKSQFAYSTYRKQISMRRMQQYIRQETRLNIMERRDVNLAVSSEGSTSYRVEHPEHANVRVEKKQIGFSGITICVK